MNGQMPIDFGWRYIGWFLWSNAITGLSILQLGFASALLAIYDPSDAHPLFPPQTVRFIFLVNAILTGVVAQIKRNSPPTPPPTKVPT